MFASLSTSRGKLWPSVHKNRMVFKHRRYSFVLSRVKYDALAYSHLEGLTPDSEERYKTKFQFPKFMECPYKALEGVGPRI